MLRMKDLSETGLFGNMTYVVTPGGCCCCGCCSSTADTSSTSSAADACAALSEHIQVDADTITLECRYDG